MAQTEKPKVPKKGPVWGLPLGMRVKLAVGDRDIAAIAQETGVSRTTIYNWIAGSNEPSLETLAKLAAVTGVNFSWLTTGQGSMRPKEDLPGFTFVQLIKPNGKEWNFVGGPIAFEQEWLIDLAGGHWSVACIEAPDDTMEPTIKRGDLLLFNNFEPVCHGGPGDIGNGIYVVGLAKFKYAIRRVQWRPAVGQKVIGSDNKKYPPETYPIGSDDFPSICGPVIWRAGTI
jgi:phage repressor protein C with HTH and peptisase S24 domain